MKWANWARSIPICSLHFFYKFMPNPGNDPCFRMVGNLHWSSIPGKIPGTTSPSLNNTFGISPNNTVNSSTPVGFLSKIKVNIFIHQLVAGLLKKTCLPNLRVIINKLLLEKHHIHFYDILFWILQTDDTVFVCKWFILETLCLSQ